MYISRNVADVYPAVFAYALRVTGLERVELPDMGRELEAGEAFARAAIGQTEDVSSHPAISVWRNAYAAAGVKPSKFRSSIEALARRAMRGTLPSVHPLVDLYNAISLRHLVPLGACDQDLIDGEVEVRLCDPGRDVFRPLGGAPEDFPLKPSIPVYAAGGQILCWCFNCRDAAPTSLRSVTSNATFFSEGVADWQLGPAEAALREIGDRLQGLGADVELVPFRVAD